MKFSVVIPTFNRRHILAPAIDSALTQDIGELEVIVVDDDSTDGSLEWLATAYSGRPVRLLRNAGLKGPAGGRNTGMRAARGQFVALLDSDDAFMPGHLADALAAFERFPELSVVFGRASYERNGQPESYMGPNFERKLALAAKLHQDARLAVFSEGFFAHLLEYGCWFNLSSVVLRRAAAAQGMNEHLRISEDYEFWVRLSRQFRFGCLLKPQIRYTLHDENISFEAAGSAADNAPHLLKALHAMRAYPNLSGEHLQLIARQMAQIYYDWAWRCSTRRQWREAARLHAASFRLGMRPLNIAAIGKMPIAMLRAALSK